MTWNPEWLDPPENAYYHVHVSGRDKPQVRLFEDGEWFWFSWKEEIDGAENGRWELVPMKNFTHWHSLPIWNGDPE